MTREFIAEPEQATSFAAWQARHAGTWAALTRAWEAHGGRGLALVPRQTASWSAASVVVNGETVAWLAGELGNRTQSCWLDGVAALIGDAISHEAELETMTDELVDSYDQLTFLYETARTLSAAETLADALEEVLAQARHIVGADGSALTVVRHGTAPLVLTNGAVPDAAFIAFTHETATSLNRALVANTAQDVCELLPAPARTCAVTSMVVAPIRTAEGVASAACFGATRPVGFTAGNRRLMQAVVEQSITIVARFALQEEQIRQSRLARDLELAAQIQTALLPAPFAGRAGIGLAVRILPANEVGGDFYIHPDGAAPPDEPFIVGIGDVAGKGVSAALVVTMCLSALRAEMRHSTSPALVLRSVGAQVADELSRIGSFATCIFAAYDATAHTLRYANAGHNPPLHWHARTGAITALAATGMPLGVDAGFPIEDAAVLFLPGDVLLLYTDGITEAMDMHGEQFGEARLRALLAATATAPPAVIEQQVIAAVQAFAPVSRDDQTVIVLRAEDRA